MTGMPVALVLLTNQPGRVSRGMTSTGSPTTLLPVPFRAWCSTSGGLRPPPKPSTADQAEDVVKGSDVFGNGAVALSSKVKAMNA